MNTYTHISDFFFFVIFRACLEIRTKIMFEVKVSIPTYQNSYFCINFALVNVN